MYNGGDLVVTSPQSTITVFVEGKDEEFREVFARSFEKIYTVKVDQVSDFSVGFQWAAATRAKLARVFFSGVPAGFSEGSSSNSAVSEDWSSALALETYFFRAGLSLKQAEFMLSIPQPFPLFLPLSH